MSKRKARVDEAEEGSRTPWKCVCGLTPCSGLDCGVYLPGQSPRKASPKKSSAELSSIRKRAWATRRAALIAKENAAPTASLRALSNE